MHGIAVGATGDTTALKSMSRNLGQIKIVETAWIDVGNHLSRQMKRQQGKTTSSQTTQRTRESSRGK